MEQRALHFSWNNHASSRIELTTAIRGWRHSQIQAFDRGQCLQTNVHMLRYKWRLLQFYLRISFTSGIFLFCSILVAKTKWAKYFSAAFAIFTCLWIFYSSIGIVYCRKEECENSKHSAIERETRPAETDSHLNQKEFKCFKHWYCWLGASGGGN